jgi:hypothetical protein
VQIHITRSSASDIGYILIQHPVCAYLFLVSAGDVSLIVFANGCARPVKGGKSVMYIWYYACMYISIDYKKLQHIGFGSSVIHGINPH